jgi:hypothetical protein
MRTNLNYVCKPADDTGRPSALTPELPLLNFGAVYKLSIFPIKNICTNLLRDEIKRVCICTCICVLFRLSVHDSRPSFNFFLRFYKIENW